MTFQEYLDSPKGEDLILELEEAFDLLNNYVKIPLDKDDYVAECLFEAYEQTISEGDDLAYSIYKERKLMDG